MEQQTNYFFIITFTNQNPFNGNWQKHEQQIVIWASKMNQGSDGIFFDILWKYVLSIKMNFK